MTPTGLASHSLRMDDSPHARGALRFCRAAAERREAETRADAALARAIADYAALVVGNLRKVRD